MSDAVQPNEAVENKPEATPALADTSAVSIASLDSSKPGAGKLDALFATVSSLFRGRTWLAAVIVAVLLILFLFLPPISLGQRLAGGGGYTRLTADAPALTHSDGLTLTLASQDKMARLGAAANKVNASPKQNVRVKLESVPRIDFMGDAAPAEVKTANAALPAHLTPKSPYYRVQVKGESDVPAQLVVTIPNEAEPWETLDVYAWDGEAWRWLPTTLNRDDETLVADALTLPQGVLVVQSGAVKPAVGAASEDLPSAEYEKVLTHLDLVGMKIGTLGNMTGNAALLPPGSASNNPVLAPAVRNWVAGREPNRGLVVDMLTLDADRAAHLTNLGALVKNGGYAGLVLDYRNLTAEDRAAYAAFVTELADTLHAQGAWLAVTVDAPQRQPDGTWNTTGYDWYTLGAVADQVRVVMPLNPQAYTPGGQAEQLLAWGASLVNRYKLYPVFTTLSTDGQQTLAMADVLGTLGNVQVKEPITQSVAPGAVLTFQLASAGAVQNDALSGATQMQVGETGYWLGTPQWLQTRLELLTRYHLGGVILADVLDEGNFPGMAEAIQNYLAQLPATAYAAPQVAWQVVAPDGSINDTTTSLTQPGYGWVAPPVTGTYRIAASVAGLSKGAVDINVAASRVVTETTTTTAATLDTATPTPTAIPTPAPGDDLKAAYVADVTVPDNTQFKKGEAFTKTWRVKNAGGKAWPETTVLQFVSGEKLASVTEVKVGAVEPGKEVDVSVEMKAPEADGTFESRWALASAGATIPGGALYTIIKAGEAPTATPTPAPTPGAVTPKPVGGGFELGGHIESGAFPYANQMHYAGMNWAKVQVRYPNDASAIVAAAHANGFKIQISALGESGMVTRGDFNQVFAGWVAGIASAGADAIEVWNEPNLPREWQDGHISPEAYTQLLCASYSAIKGANAGTWVISAAMAPTGYFGGCHGSGCDDLPFLQRMYNAGAVNCMDFIGAHHNSGATAPSATIGHPADPGSTHHSWFFLPQTRLYYNTFGGARQLFYTELGYVSPEGYGWIPDTFAWGGKTTVAQQAQWLSEVVSLSSQTGMVRVVIVWNIDYRCYGPCGGVQDPQGGYAIIRPDGSCPACETLHALLGTR